MTLMSRVFARVYRLPPARTYDIVVEKDLQVPMGDGVQLLADRYSPRQGERLATVLVRTPYGRAGIGLMGQIFAERGFQAIIQACRGTNGSGGESQPFRGEREDGLATLAWLEQQPWFDGRLGMAGPSYMGFTQWALGVAAGSRLGALCTQVTSSEFRTAMYPGGTFQLEIFLQWMQITRAMSGSMVQSLRALASAGRRARVAVRTLPLSEADVAAVGAPMKFWRDWVQHSEPDDPWWTSEDFSRHLAEVRAPNHLISGWYDFLLPQLVRDFEALRRAGHRPYLTIGPWSHSSSELSAVAMRESLHWLRAHLLGERSALRELPVRVYVMGAGEWRDLPDWPPPGAQARRWYLHEGGRLDEDPPGASAEATRFRYDPGDPTPNVGGATNATLGRGAGARDNRRLEARSDVRIFTSAPLTRALEVMGPVAAEVFLRSSAESTDLFVRLCDVHPDGKSLNVCDGIVRLSPLRPAADAEGCRGVTVELSPTAYRFKAGHRLRLQVSSGAFPRFARNLGTLEPMTSATTLRVAKQELFHDSTRPSAVTLSVA